MKKIASAVRGSVEAESRFPNAPLYVIPSAVATIATADGILCRSTPDCSVSFIDEETPRSERALAAPIKRAALKSRRRSVVIVLLLYTAGS